MAQDAVAAQAEIAKLRFQLARYRRAEFGRSSEKLAREADQLELAIEALETDQAERLAAASPGVAAELMASDTLYVDDTPVPVLAPGAGKTKTGRLWTYVRDERPFNGDRPPAALFFYSPDRKGEHPRAHLRDFRGVIH